jgi:hypothetical protein
VVSERSATVRPKAGGVVSERSATVRPKAGGVVSERSATVRLKRWGGGPDKISYTVLKGGARAASFFGSLVPDSALTTPPDPPFTRGGKDAELSMI